MQTQLAARPRVAQRIGSARVSRRPHALRAAVRPAVQAADTASVSDDVAGPSRRQLLSAALASLLLAPANSSLAKTCASETVTEDEDTDCRRAVLARDSAASADSGGQYAAQSSVKTFSAAPGVPVAVLDKTYVNATLKLRDSILQYANSDVNDFKTRVPLIKELKTEGLEWVSKYARGGSARTQSARSMYIAVDALIGHIAANGYAPMPKPKLKIVLTNIDQAASYLAENK